MLDPDHSTGHNDSGSHTSISSSSSDFNGAAATTQFQPGTNGCTQSGLELDAVMADPPKQ